MKRFVLGFVVGALAFGGTAWAGFFFDGYALQKLRGQPCGEAAYRAYVAGVHDLLAGLYPVTGHTLADIEGATVNAILANGHDKATMELAGAVLVAKALADKKVITDTDLLRVLPESWREKYQKGTLK